MFKYNCDKCVYKTNDNGNFHRHVSTHSLNKPFECDICCKSFTNTKNLNSHKIIHSEEKQYSCTICNSDFKRKSGLNNHIKTHSGNNKQECPECNKHVTNLTKHVKNVHSKETYKCATCNLILKNEKSYKNHLKVIHSEQPRVDCIVDDCDKYFFDISKRNSHVREVHKISIYNCSFCDEKFDKTANLNEHLNKEHYTKPILTCDLCNLELDTQERLNEHVYYKHTTIEEKTYKFKCKYTNCEFIGKYKCHLDIHVKSHENKREHVCNYCNDSFNYKHYLTDHINAKHLKLEYECYICKGISFSKRTLRKHLYTHTDRIKIKCELCECSYYNKSHLNRHVDSVHTERGLQRRKLKEEQVRNFLFEKGILNIDSLREFRIDFKCTDKNSTFCRIDFYIVHNGILFLLEVDEHQHYTYSQACETAKMYNVFETLTLGGNTLPIVFIRYNPDKFTIDDEVVKIYKTERMEQVYNFITNYSHDNRKYAIIYFFYDLVNDNLSVLDDPEYNDEVKQFII